MGPREHSAGRGQHQHYGSGDGVSESWRGVRPSVPYTPEWLSHCNIAMATSPWPFHGQRTFKALRGLRPSLPVEGIARDKPQTSGHSSEGDRMETEGAA